MQNYIPFTPKRVQSIDVFRALTMVIMIFVNDLGSVAGVPHWLEHAAMTEDFLGFSDLVFPAFLVVMGMSIPLAIESKIQKGESKADILESIASRTFALIVMGLVLLNAGRGVAEDLIINRHAFMILSLVGFFLVWNLYPKAKTPGAGQMQRILKVVGYILIFTLIYIYRDPKGNTFQQGWWGILGLIGWAYGICAVIYLYYRKSVKALIVAYLFFLVLTALGSSDYLGPFNRLIPDNGCHHAFAMTGVLTTLLLLHNKLGLHLSQRLMILAAAGLVMVGLGWLSNNIWIISKIQATPPWLLYSSGLTLLFYVFIYWLTDIKGKSSWFSIIGPAGTATLTCYLIPYLLYTIIYMTGFRFPNFLSVSPLGLFKCLFISLITVGITALIGRMGVKLKI
ncbi:heparan-alpha-glucosaminide N-acetyltransferase [Dysgonomonas sp. PFB1-18]|uniref:DUF5009 domain-containing protein n=1 Tax=unclassified Dysgonomonas TaxID=2630389 RepID=UPI00247539B9|nr:MULTISPECIES: DUF5009 domain-containing protein [unclassified Dysgonomonas]MDH6308904.1 heparan-alpha-glucosaminide N-acetyltransferase [Dysgonomonas sp. PF1-14]MDH6338655.1 heparan-alpha-glucosaminide N-acetyltransferase [Dysgonomonas sp. PF1-16]MDH6380317.1 heparan-alpha-glucosaminide N-acetyltransferase [Dysgonomonas sp. PFB1-18]MDH6397647.1 heparan-alpha-glucosaminide N-acetyltransferase [Dysgonomonas sp. PF1-23]